MRTLPSKDQYIAWAARARRQARDASTEIARAIHIQVAREFEAKVARATRVEV
ncbi:hypothetical protein U1839_04370 [Sphingomonas sp. RT2P30]|uniref:hypothetical protein n=1 Tax=Parasphingomonas halimpatiens TaxID=3096162 RepID=UPI002FC674D3